MGLDSYWKDSKTGEVVHLGKDYKLCGGLMSGHGDGSFRGKVYDSLVEEITGVSLYSERIPNATVKEMASKLAAANTEELEGFEITPEEFKNLVQMFQDYAEAGCDLSGWW